MSINQVTIIVFHLNTPVFESCPSAGSGVMPLPAAGNTGKMYSTYAPSFWLFISLALNWPGHIRCLILSTPGRE